MECPQTARLLLDDGANIEGEGTGPKAPRTPLAWTCVLGFYEVCNLLLERGANTETDPGTRSHPLMEACMQGQHTIIKLLLHKGTRCDGRDDEGYTELTLATRYNCIEIVTVLLNHGVEVDAITDFNETSLQIATKKQFVEFARLLMKARANQKPVSIEEIGDEAFWDLTRKKEIGDKILEKLGGGGKSD